MHRALGECCMTPAEFSEVKSFFLQLQENIHAMFTSVSGDAFRTETWERTTGPLLGNGRLFLCEEGSVLERCGVAFSHVRASKLPPAATERHPELAGLPYEVVGVSVVAHPRNPHAPTCHLNVRCFRVNDGQAWWFGGGFDLTPILPHDEDVDHWHQTTHSVCEPFGPHVEQEIRGECDRYFYLKHRQEPRGVGGVFAEDVTAGAFGFTLIRAIGEGFVSGMGPILQRRKSHATNAHERAFQIVRRGRYAEFNLVWDRGTLFGLQSGGRAASILMSMPPHAGWIYDEETPFAAEYERLRAAWARRTV
jgi:coproporphyrinogen III oxidase